MNSLSLLSKLNEAETIDELKEVITEILDEYDYGILSEHEEIFIKLNPKWDGWSRWVFEFHVIEVRK